YNEYLFGYHSLDVPDSPVHGYRSSAAAYVQGDPLTRVVDPFAGVMRVYQRYVWLPGTMYGLILLAGLAALVLRWRAGGRGALRAWGSSPGVCPLPGRAGGVRLPLRDDGGAVRLPGAGDRLGPGAAGTRRRDPGRRGRRPGRRCGRRLSRRRLRRQWQRA